MPIKRRELLETLQREALDDVRFRYDPFDLTFSRIDPADLFQRRETLTERRRALDTLLKQSSRMKEDGEKCVGQMQDWQCAIASIG